MLVWLVPVALFWGLAAIYLGGAPIQISGGSGQQLLGLLLHFASYLVVFGILSAVLTGVAGPIFGQVVFPLLGASILLPLLAKITFRLVGVRITGQS